MDYLYPGSVPDLEEWTPKNLREFYAELQLPTSEFVRSCRFGTEASDCRSEFQQVLNADYGICWMLNLRRTQRVPGVGGGLHLVLSTDSILGDQPNTYPPSFLLDQGYYYDALHISAQPQNALQPLLTNTILVAPATINEMHLEPKKFTLVERSRPEMIGIKVGNKLCNADVEFQALDLNLTVSNCQFDCFIAKTIKKCGCLPLVEETFLKKEIRMKYKTCKVKDMQECAFQDFEQDDSHCREQCLSPCEYWNYDVKVSSAGFPSRYWESADVSGAEPLDKEFADFQDASKNKNTIILEIHFPHLQFIDIEQEYAMTFSNFLGNIGGLFGLWLGPSIVILIKVMYLLICAICGCGGSNNDIEEMELERNYPEIMALMEKMRAESDRHLKTEILKQEQRLNEKIRSCLKAKK